MQLLLSLLLFLSYSVQAKSVPNLKRLAFGSCNSQYDKQPLWDDIIKQRPDLWVWAGDAVYGDWKSTQSLRDAFALQETNRGYQRFKKLIPFIGTWDDHDYGHDNADGRLSYKKESQRLFLNFLEEPADSPRRQQEGIYTSYEYQSDGRAVKIILLDNRYFKNLDSQFPLLGQTQWEWLEEELKNSRAHLHFIVTGLSIFSPLLPYTEEWSEHPQEKARLVNLISKYQVKAPVFLTGDKHFSSIFMRENQLEFMSSGMTHIASSRIWWYLRARYPNVLFRLNYGLIDIEWKNEMPRLRMVMRDVNGKDVNENFFRWSGKRWMSE